MSSREMLVTLNPVQAANGVILPVELPTGPVRLRIPPCRHGDLVRVRVGSEEVLLRVHVSGSGMAWIAGAGGITPPADGPAGPPAGTPAGSPPPPPPPGSAGRRTGLVAVLALAAVITAVVLLAGGGGDDGDRRDDARPAATASPTASGLWSPAPSSPYSAATGAPSAYPTRYDPVPSTEPSPEASPEPSPFDRGTCLNGRLPDSTTPTTVTGVEEVPCSASDAHYRVIESLPGTSDLNACNSNSRTQYAFSYRYTRGGTVLNQYVYCLVGIGSYAR